MKLIFRPLGSNITPNIEKPCSKTDLPNQQLIMMKKLKPKQLEKCEVTLTFYQKRQ